MVSALRVLIVEDSPDDTALLVRELRRGGYDVSFERVEDAQAMNSALANHSWDLVISDYTLPHFSGFSALELFKQSGIDIPFIMVSGTIGEETAVDVMKVGAHDYLMKDNIRRLIPSVNRELREADVRRERRRVEEENQRNWQRIRILHEIDLAITSTLDLQAILNIFLEKIAHLLSSSATTIKLTDIKTGELIPVACRNIDENQWRENGRKGIAGLAKIVLENKIPLTVANVQTDPRSGDSAFVTRENLVSYLGIPLIAKNETLGVIAFYFRESHRFSDDEIEFLTTLASQASVAISNSLLYERSRRQAVELEASNKIKDEFLSVLSHELRTPLNLILGFTSMIKEEAIGKVTSRQKQILGKITSHTNDLLAMINDILYTTSLEANLIKGEIETFDLREFFDGLKSNYSVLIDKKLDLIWDYPTDLPNIRSDQRKLRQILQNLINNAIKFTDTGTVTVSARHKPENGQMEFSVADTGIGIPQQMLGTIFEKFRQADSSETRAYGGVGLGLYIVKRFVKLLNGEIRLESKVGKGSLFIVTIPLVGQNAPHQHNCHSPRNHVG